MYTKFLLFFATVFLVYIYYRLNKLYSYFERNGIPYIKPILLLGNTKDWIFMKKALSMVYYDVYEKLDPHRFCGVFVGWRKVILVRDPELIRNILVKDFSYFYNREVEPTPKTDFLNENLMEMRGDEWKTLRAKLTTTFTPVKMKDMYPLIQDCGKKLHFILHNLVNKDILIKDICARYTTDVIGICAFGLNINSLNDPDSIFTQMGNRVLETSFINTLRAAFPKLDLFFDPFGSDNILQAFFLNFVKDTVQHRLDHKIVRGDLLDLLISLKLDADSHKSKQCHLAHQKNHTSIEMTDELMTAQCFAYFIGSFATSSSALSYMLLELAQNQHIQDKLRNEIITVLENNNNELTYEAMKQLKYMDMVIDETLRKYPVAGNICRACCKPYQIPDSEFVIPERTKIVISIRGIHYDPKYYEKPLEFYPEHFTEKAKARRPHFTFLPFGGGPRICIGERFAKMQIKVGAVNLLKDLSYHVSPKMKFPIEHAPGLFLFNVKGGIWLRCEKL
uniref:Cytochrome P450 6PZ17 n=1 Tax=Maconellicoccus hirsutus TaxID=177089 RepID=A0AAT9UTS4_MACHI